MIGFAFWNPGNQLLIWGVNVLLQITLVTAIALVASRRLRRSPAARYWVLCASLLLVLLSPVIVLVMQSSGRGLLSVTLMNDLADSNVEETTSELFAGKPTPEFRSTPALMGEGASAKLVQSAEQSTANLYELATDPSQLNPATPLTNGSTDTSSADTSLLGDLATVPAPSRTANWIGTSLRIGMPPILLVWFIGAAFLLGRLIVGWCKLIAILRSSQPNASQELAALFVQVGQALHIARMPELVLSNQLPGPVAAGLWRPRIVLPVSMVDRVTPAQLHDILIHEVAHILRRDPMIVLLQNLASAMFWLHPLARMLNRELAQAREEVCDNYVLASTDAPSYSRTLLTLAELVHGARPLPGTVGLFTSRWKLEHRVAGLLDHRRNLMTRLSASGKTLVFAMSLIMAALAACGTLRLSAGQAGHGGDTEDPKPAVPPTSNSKSNDSTPPATQSVQVSGVVLKPNGTPAAGAKVRAAASLWGDLQEFLGEDYETTMSVATTDELGRFTITIHTRPFGDVSKLGQFWSEQWKRTQIAAIADGFGPAWIDYEEIRPDKPITLRLVEDIPIRGRIIDLEGRPVANTVVEIGGPVAAVGEDLSKWLDSIKAGETSRTAYEHASRSTDPRLIGTPEKVITAVDGSFEVRGFGKERIVRLVFEGESVAHRSVSVVTRKMPPIQKLISVYDKSTETIFGSEFTFTAAPTRPIEGTVVDAQTRKPLAGVLVESYKLADFPISANSVLKTTTNAEGRFRLVGMPKATGNILMMVPNDEQPYLMRRVPVPDPPGIEPVPMTIELHRGIWISGRITDKSTGEPVPGVRVHYLPFRSNEFAQALPEFDKDGNTDGDQRRYKTKSDGTYRLVGLPGRAVVGAESIYKSYRYGVGYEAIDAPKEGKSDWLLTYRNPINPGRKWPSVMREIHPEKGVEEVKLDLELDPGASIKLQVVDENDRPVTGVDCDGLSPRFYEPKADDSVLTAVNFSPDETRPIIIHHKGRNIGRVVQVGPTEIAQGEMRVKLLPCTTVTGRLLSREEPLTGLMIEPRLLPGGDFSKRLPSAATDLEGRFTCTLIPGCHYNLHAEGKGLDLFATVADELAIEPGESKDLGTLTLEKGRKFVMVAAQVAPRTETEKQESTTTVQAKPNSSSNTTIIRGTISDTEGKPAPGTFVAVVGLNVQPKPEANKLMPWAEVLGEGKADENGRFEFRLQGVSSKTHVYPNVMARTEQSGLAWRQVDLDAAENEAKLTLKPEQLIQVRLVDLEGQPAAGVRVQLQSIIVVNPGGPPREAIAFPLPSAPNSPGLPGQPSSGSLEIPAPKAWIAALKTDDRGLLTVRNIAAENGLYLQIVGTDRFATQDLALNTGESEERGENDLTYRSIVKNIRPGEVATLPIAPAQFFEGVVRYADTRQPAPHARLTILASQQEKFGSMVSVEGKTDAQGRFRLNPKPGVRFGIHAYPPAGAPYQVKRLDNLRWKLGATSQAIEIELTRGVMARGKIVESDSNTPVHGASVQYIPDQVHNKNLTDDIVTGWQSIQKSDAEGNFQITVFPGPGTLLVHGTRGQFIFKQIGSRQLESGKPGGYRSYANAIHPIDPQPGAEFAELTIKLDRGKTIGGRLTNEAGNPIEHALVVSLLNIQPTSPWWRGFPANARNGRFELGGLADGEKYLVYFLDAKQQLGATASLTAADNAATIVLRPCGDAKARFVDPDGKPAVGIQLGLHLVMTPGKSRYDNQAILNGELVADEDFAANVDPFNNRPDRETNAQGEVTFPALIPGARYRFVNLIQGIPRIEKEFVAESAKTFDLGQIVVQLNN